MATAETLAALQSARTLHSQARDVYVARLIEIALESVAEVLPGARVLEVLGEFSEESVPTLRVQRVLNGAGSVLFDVAHGHADRNVEDMIDLVDIEYLDVMIELAADRYLGEHRIGGV